MSTNLNKLIASKLASIKAAAEVQPESREEVVAARVVATLTHLGVEEGRIRAALEGEEPVGEVESTPMDEANPITDEEVEAGCRAVLAELGIEVEEDEILAEGDEDVLLDEISELTAKLIAAGQKNPGSLYKTASRLTASLNLTLVAAGKQQ